MDVIYKGGSLLYTQISSVARVCLSLPVCLLQCIVRTISTNSSGLDSSSSSCVFYEGVVTHARKRPVANTFEYPVRVAVVDLDDPPAWFARGQQRDHLTAAQARAFAATDGKVLLLTNPVSAGYTQNPISVYYCYGAQGGEQQQQQQQGGDSSGGTQENWPTGSPSRAIAEVTNTPWGDQVRFAFSPGGDQAPKALHVSPFMDMDNTWHLKATPPGEGLKLSVVVTHPRLGQYFDAHLIAKRCTGPGARELNEHAGLGSLLRYGFMPQRVALWIYWQAVILIAKGCPIYPKPPGDSYKGRVEEQAKGKLPDAGRSGCPFQWTDTRAWPWYL